MAKRAAATAAAKTAAAAKKPKVSTKKKATTSGTSKSDSSSDSGDSSDGTSGSDATDTDTSTEGSSPTSDDDRDAAVAAAIPMPPRAEVLRLPAVAAPLMVFRGASLAAGAGAFDTEHTAIERAEWEAACRADGVPMGGPALGGAAAKLVAWRFPA
jgi:hypothetical protein